MTTRTKVIGVLLGLLIVAGGAAAAFYLVVYAYPVWVSERFETADNLEGSGMARMLLIGKVAHGRQYLKPSAPQEVGKADVDFSRLATTYYHRSGPVGRAMEMFNWFHGPDNTYAADARMAASQLGLCAMPGAVPWAPLVAVWSEPPYAAILIKDGCMASYARPYQCVDFYERNPAFIGLSLPAANEQPRFTFIRDARDRGANVRVLEGPERTSLAERGPRQFYHVLVVDTARGRTDVLAQELMTKEAMAQYFETLVDEGVVLLHTSNREYDLVPIMADVARSLGLSCVALVDGGVPTGGGPRGHFSSEWVLVARNAPALARVRAQLNPNPGRNDVSIRWLPLQSSGGPVWTDGAEHALGRLRR